MIFPYSKSEAQVNSGGMQGNGGSLPTAFRADHPPGDASGEGGRTDRGPAGHSRGVELLTGPFRGRPDADGDEGSRAASQQDNRTGLPGMAMLRPVGERTPWAMRSIGFTGWHWRCALDEELVHQGLGGCGKIGPHRAARIQVSADALQERQRELHADTFLRPDRWHDRELGVGGVEGLLDALGALTGDHGLAEERMRNIHRVPVRLERAADRIDDARSALGGHGRAALHRGHQHAHWRWHRL